MNPLDSAPPRALPQLSSEMALQVLMSALHAAENESSGTRLGPYTLLEKLGEGGFGTVWMAEQEAPIRRRVALKIIKAGMDTEEVIARFEAERQALAMMDHPNIAHVYDAGVTTGGRPFVVMELVRGTCITRYCDEHQLTPEGRLGLFTKVCQAVQHAHQKGVIHRDLKPSNILVTRHDGVPVPKVIDFGIAKATGARLTDKTLFTRMHAFMGTPAYMSPEQMEMSGLDVDTRSDIYSLGVLLYELLTGRPPFDPQVLVESGLDVMRRTLREVDPPRPSHRLRTLSAEDRTTVAGRRSIDPAKLSGLLCGDLDWIAMRCLEKDRTRRYDSAAALAADIERHLADAPVTARPPSRVYQAGKFIRRHRLAVGAAAAVALALVAGLVVSSTLLVSERAARARASLAEKNETELRRQADVARAAETKRVARTAVELANRHLADGKIADGIAYLVYAARKDPFNRTLAPRLASALASYPFAIPQAAPNRFGSRVVELRFAADGHSFFVGTENGAFHVLDSATGTVRRRIQVVGEIVPFGWEFARLNENVIGARLSDTTFHVYDLAKGTAKFPPLQLPQGLGLPDTARMAGLSPKGRWIYANARNEFWLWNADTGALQLNLKFTELIGVCDFSPEDDILAMPVGETIERWTLPAGQGAGPSIRFRDTAGAQRGFGYRIRFSPDGRRLAVTERDGVRIFDAVSGALTHTLLGEIARNVEPSFTSFLTNDRVLVLADGKCGYWNLEDDRFTSSELPPFMESPLRMAGERGAVVTRDGALHVFKVGGRPEATWSERTAYRAAVSPDGTQALMGTSEGLLYRFSLGREATRPLVLPRSMAPPMPAPFLPEFPARLLRMGGDRATAIDVVSGREISGGFPFPEPVLQYPLQETYPPLRPDMTFMVVRTAQRGWQSWEVGVEGVRRVVPLSEAVAVPSVIHHGLAGELVALGNPGSIRVWNLRSGRPAGPALNYPAFLNVFSVSFGADPSRIAVGANDGAALVFDVATGLPVLALKTPRQVRTAFVQFSADGTRLFTTNVNGESRLWNARTGEPIGPTLRLIGPAHRPVFSPDGRWIAVHNSSAVTLVDGRTGIAAGHRIPFNGDSVRFSPDGNRLATGGVESADETKGVARVWDVLTGEPVTEPMRHPAFASVPEFSPDGRFLKTQNKDLRLWALPPALPEGMPPPEWLFELATLFASTVVNDAGQLVSASEAAANVGRLRQQIAALPADAPLADWGKWILDDRADRPIAPGFTITPTEADAVAGVAGVAGKN